MPLTRSSSPAPLEAGPDDAWDLMHLEKAANLVGLAHVFPPSRFPYPEGHVLARWAIVLDSPDVTTLVWPPDPALVDALEPPTRLLFTDQRTRFVAFAAYDDSSLRHLGVHPALWGNGLGRVAVEAAVSGIKARGSDQAFLWCLVENVRARRLYERLGWTPTGERQDAQFPPHPEEMQYSLALR